ncbi:MAG: hypothetical protein GY724_28095 [Actinomycetia bacterium]|nr:hypothetical protein [Actinomycetes bacterium]
MAMIVSPARAYRAEAEAPLPLWPVVLMISAYPIWFLLGLGGFMWVGFAAPMTASLVRRRDLKAPRGMGLWAVFLLAVVISGLSIDTPARFSGYALRLGYYLAATVFVIYLLNGGQTVSVARIVRSFTVLWMVTIAFGYLALILGDASFHSPMWYLMPATLLQNDFIATLVTPGFADVQDIIGVPVPRPKAPFPYTNSWGSMVALTTPFALIALSDARVDLPRRLVKITLAAAVVPIVVSLNRGLWLSLGIGLAYVALRLGFGGHRHILQRFALLVVALVAVVVLSPLGDLVSARIDNGHSDGDRTALATAAIEGATERPIFGWGAPRPNVGSQPSVGTHGQIWLVTFSHGFVGAAGFIGALGSFLYWTRRQTTTSGVLANSVLLIALVQMPVYLMIPHSLFAVMAALAVALRYQTNIEDGPTRDALQPA